MGWLRLLAVFAALGCGMLVLLSLLTRQRRYLDLAIRLARTGLVLFLLLMAYYAISRLVESP